MWMWDCLTCPGAGALWSLLQVTLGECKLVASLHWYLYFSDGIPSCCCVWFLQWRFQHLNTGCGYFCDCTICRLFQQNRAWWLHGEYLYYLTLAFHASVSLKLVCSVMTLFLFPLLQCLVSCTRKEGEYDSPEPQVLHLSFRTDMLEKQSWLSLCSLSVLQMQVLVQCSRC